MQIIRPHITLLVLCSVGIFAWLIMLLFPKEGIMIGGLKIRFSAPLASTDSLKERKIEDVEKFLAQFDSLQIETASVDSIHADTTTLVVSRKENIASLQFKDGDSSPLFPFFEALDSAKANGKKVHIFHYGDSQIESDRMSNVIRLKLQEKFGGNGPGLIAPVPVTASANIGQSQSDNWKRYTAYGFDNGKANHNNYGILCAFGRFTDAKKVSDINTKDTTEAWIELRPTSMAVGTCKLYNEAILYFGNVLSPFILTVMSDDAVLSSEIIPVGTQLSSRSWNLSSVPKKLKFFFKGPDSPDVYGIELHGSGGVNLSNIALRGNDGAAFKKINGSSMKPVFEDLHAELFILQFGGNAVPFLKSNQSATNYGNAFKTHIRFLKALCPNACFIIIGPSDMSTTIDGVYQTWPYLESLKNGMKQAAFDEGCAFWDMYEVMGGKNSMVSWVTNNPPYAGPDYTHFTPAGARKVAELFYKALSDEYDAWKKAQNELP